MHKRPGLLPGPGRCASFTDAEARFRQALAIDPVNADLGLAPVAIANLGDLGIPKTLPTLAADEPDSGRSPSVDPT